MVGCNTDFAAMILYNLQLKLLNLEKKFTLIFFDAFHVKQCLCQSLHSSSMLFDETSGSWTPCSLRRFRCIMPWTSTPSINSLPTWVPIQIKINVKHMVNLQMEFRVIMHIGQVFLKRIHSILKEHHKVHRKRYTKLGNHPWGLKSLIWGGYDLTQNFTEW